MHFANLFAVLKPAVRKDQTLFRVNFRTEETKKVSCK